MVRRDFTAAARELRQIAECLGMASHSLYAEEIKDIEREVQKILKDQRGIQRMEFIIAHLIMSAKDRGPQK